MITTQSELTISSINNWNLHQWNHSKLLLITSCTCTTTVLNTGWADIPPSKYSQAGPIFSIVTQVSILTQHHSFNTRVEMLAKFLVSIKAYLSSQELPRLVPQRGNADAPAPHGGTPHLCIYGYAKRHSPTRLPFGPLQTPFQFTRSKVTLEEERGKLWGIIFQPRSL